MQVGQHSTSNMAFQLLQHSQANSSRSSALVSSSPACRTLTCRRQHGRGCLTRLWYTTRGATAGLPAESRYALRQAACPPAAPLLPGGHPLRRQILPRAYPKGQQHRRRQHRKLEAAAAPGGRRRRPLAPGLPAPAPRWPGDRGRNPQELRLGVETRQWRNISKQQHEALQGTYVRIACHPISSCFKLLHRCKCNHHQQAPEATSHLLQRQKKTAENYGCRSRRPRCVPPTRFGRCHQMQVTENETAPAAVAQSTAGSQRAGRRPRCGPAADLQPQQRPAQRWPPGMPSGTRLCVSSRDHKGSLAFRKPDSRTLRRQKISQLV